ncbi:hypothetical protein X471_01159 [Bartonella bacilliformis str. Heidi Mejia]|uniref:Uncharacterized protein n=3 Tax=Bartonella bacilliformis TaxID=774 RepID=A1UTW9_BARBK|nr:hypothetical protein [Bartonella bacilliformis]ABM44717.1 hypothetical protein BARBAKC583_1164 [Bartonella bacilliformis KC583]EKS43060.1 hypothetical protein BbINS_05477 [Bartonella bacilliformis INS]EYS88600.1 hypothetical protein X472_01151 [Bartonella bacilliformis San Pedro600-02]EYS91024.1 hypothetical protein X471_01159 [Bartonella bacilliformis str. Heidi Mejia]EYS94422.1 hypothetical protein X470_01126 [Bartonella bacilliformis Peru-18]
MIPSDLQTLDSSIAQRKRRIIRDIVQYIFVIVMSLSALIAAFLSFSDRLNINWYL